MNELLNYSHVNLGFAKKNSDYYTVVFSELFPIHFGENIAKEHMTVLDQGYGSIKSFNDKNHSVIIDSPIIIYDNIMKGRINCHIISKIVNDKTLDGIFKFNMHVQYNIINYLQMFSPTGKYQDWYLMVQFVPEKYNLFSTTANVHHNQGGSKVFFNNTVSELEFKYIAEGIDSNKDEKGDYSTIEL